MTTTFDAYLPGNQFSAGSPQGPRNNKWHAGQDYPANEGVAIRAAATGTVYYSGYNESYGNLVIIKHSPPDMPDFFTLYAHGTGGNMPALGSTVYAGELIGNVANTGSTSQGNHLHFEVLTGDAPVRYASGGPMGFSSSEQRYRYHAASFNYWGSLDHMIGTDQTGDPLVAVTNGSLVDGDYHRTVVKLNATTGEVIDNYFTYVEAISNGGNLTGYNVTTQNGAGQPIIQTKLNKDFSIAFEAHTNAQGQFTSFTQAGIRIDIAPDGSRTAYIPGHDAGVPVSASGEIAFESYSGLIEIGLASDPLQGGFVYANGELHSFSGGAEIYATQGGIGLWEAFTIDIGADAATNTIISGNGTSTKLNYQKGQGGTPKLSPGNSNQIEDDWPSDLNSPFQHGADADGIWFLESTESIHLAYNGTGTMSDVSNPLFSLSTNPDLQPTQSTATDPTNTSAVDANLLISKPTYQVTGVGNVNEATGNQQGANAILTPVRPAAEEVLHFDDWNTGVEVTPENIQNLGAYTNQQATGATEWVPVDPLLLDLNGDGVKLTSFAEAPVLFDIDHDASATQEITGWVSAQDGIVVMDVNGNGRIDGIHETMSEYFNGAIGTNGEAGTKPYANGFAALKSLDSNHDNQFTSTDTAWNNVQVWVDADHDAVTDTGELHSLASLGISSINLTPTTQSGLVNGGNEVLATGSFTLNGQTREAQAARFIANPTGNSFTVGANGTTVNAEDGQTTYISNLTTGETIDVTTKGVKNAYGGSGNDTLTGDANANWLVGGQGSDTLNAGAGDDMLIIDAADLQTNLHAGDGFDMAQVVGSEGVTLNLAQAELEVVAGGTGDDLFIGGGRSSVFVRANDGDDIVIGGAANDALSGENGADLIDGGAGNDLIRGGRGQDQLLGGVGDDLLFAGQDDDSLSGGTGNDVLKGEQGDDSLDGGDGTDIAEYTGSYADYRIVRLTDTTYRITDTQTGRDGGDLLTNIEKLNFADVSAVDLTLDNPLPVNDVHTLDNRTGVKLIRVADLLQNDRDWQNDALHLTTLSDLQGGTIAGAYNAASGEWTPTLTANGELQFTPDPAYTGVMGFKYKIADTDNTPGATALIPNTTTQAEMRAQVWLKTPDMPQDPGYTDQWYLNDIRVQPVWSDAYGQGYTGAGIKIGMFEPGMPFSTGAEVFNYRHPDLQANADTAWLADGNLPQSFSQHATLVAGVMVAAHNGQGGVGVAYNASLAGWHIDPGASDAELLANINQAQTRYRDYDIVNNSWAATTDFQFGTVTVGALPTPIKDALDNGRGGLGTAIVFAGGNTRQEGGNTNTNAFTANRGVIVAGAINANADISTLSLSQTPFSNPGASILIAAPGSNVDSTGNVLETNDGNLFGADTSTTQGTSFAAPIVSGVIALMLEANPNLGWRDVRQILAIPSGEGANDSFWRTAA